MDKRILVMVLASAHYMDAPEAPKIASGIKNDGSVKANNIKFYQKQKHRKKKGGKINFR